jgi:lysozyme
MKRDVIALITIGGLAFFLFKKSDDQVIDHPAVQPPVRERVFRPIEPGSNEIEIASELVKRWEGFSNVVYICAAGVETIGYGETDPAIVSKGYISEADAEKLLVNKLEQIRDDIQTEIEVPLNKNELAALISFYYNLGESNFKNIARRINNGKIEEASEAILLYDKCKGRPLDGLKKRRRDEHKLFNL